MAERVSNEEWREMKRAERQAVTENQKTAMSRATASGEALLTYMVGRGRLGSQLSSGNAALVLEAMPNARVVKNFDQWNEFGRRISKGAKGVCVMSRRKQYPIVERVYELSQTFGKVPYVMSTLDSAEKIKKAVNALTALSPVEIVAGDSIFGDVYFDTQSHHIMVSPYVSDEELFQLLPAQIVRAYMEKAETGASETPQCELYATCVSAELCGRFGVPVQKDAQEKMDALLPYVIEQGHEREHLETVREFSRTMGNNVHRDLFPQEHAPTSRESR